MSGLVNKIKEAVHGDKKHEQPTGTSGPHDSRAANAADPRVDSDRDHRANPAGATTGTTGTHGTSGRSAGLSGVSGTSGTTNTASNTYGAGATGSGLGGGDNFTQSGTGVSGAPGGTSGLGSSNTYGNTSTNAGPHSSNLANKADPRVDSDRDHRAGATGGIGSTGAGEFGSSRTTGTTGTTEFGSAGGIGSTTRSGTEYGSSNAGPHSSNLANKADPRVDSDRDHRVGATGTGVTGGNYGTTGSSGLGSSHTHGTTGTSGLGSSNTYGNTSTNAGPHDSNLANKADPRVDSDRDHRTGTTGTGIGGNNYGSTGTHGASSGLGGVNPGPAPNTAGPHKSDMLNKVDPRVDSDRDGSKTVGQDQTYARSGNTTSTAHRDPTDAAQVPPSVLAKHIGEPSVEHDYPDHDRARRNSAVPHQEAHRGL